MNRHKYVGKTLEEAQNRAMEDLRETLDNLYIKETNVKNGLFNKKVEIEVLEKNDIIEFIKQYLLDITKQMGLKVNIELKKREDTINIILYSDNNALLIGRNGKTLEALNIVTRQMLLRELGFIFHFSLDVEEYKMKRQTDLERLAKRTAKEVASSKIEVKLGFMNSYERRIIHNALSNIKDVYTESVGEEPDRCVVVKPRED